MSEDTRQAGRSRHAWFYRLSVKGPPAGAFCIPTRWPAPPRRKDLVVERVGEGDPRARVPDPGARTRLAYEVTVVALHGMYGRRRWGGEDGPASCSQSVIVEGGAGGFFWYPDAVAGATRETNLVGRVGEGGPCARVPDHGARN